MTTLLRAEHLSCRDGNHLRVDSLHFSIAAGETIGLLGTNGAGKSTALALLAGALAPTAGRVMCLEQDLHRASRKLRRNIGLLPELPPLHPDLTVDENLGFAARMHGIARRAVATACGRVLEQCQLNPLQRRLARRLSRGEAQRVGIAMALVHDPRVLLLDEPTAGLDPLQAQELHSLLLNLRGTRAVLLSTHLLPDVEALCTRAVLLHEGAQAADLNLRDRSPIAARVRLRNVPSAKSLTDLPGVRGYAQRADGWWQLELSDDTPAELPEIIAARAWGLEAYIPVAHNLAERFSALATRGTEQ